MEAKLVALDVIFIEAEWLKSFWKIFFFLPKPKPPISLHCDSQVAIAKVKSKNYNKKIDI